MPNVLFKGGKCAGIHTPVDDRSVTGGTIVCGGDTYTLKELYPDQWLATSDKPASENTSEPIPIDGGLSAAWGELARAVGRKVPAQINAATRARRKLRAAGRL